MYPRLVIYMLMMVVAAGCSSMHGASNRISSSSIVVNGPLSDAEVEAIHELKSWPYVEVRLGAGAGDPAFKSLAKIPEVRLLEFSNSNKGITSFEPVRSLPSLVSFRAYSPKLNRDVPWSLKPFAVCKDLIVLNLNRTLVSDEDSLSACTKLRFLNLADSGNASLDFLASMPELQELFVGSSDVPIRSYSPIGRLSNLRNLSLYGSGEINDETLQALSGLTQLRKFSCSKTNIRSLDFLRNCVAMERLSVSRNSELVDIAAIADMQYLLIVYLSHTSVKELDALEGKAYLQDISINSTQVDTLAPLKNCVGLRKIDIGSTAVTDLSPLARKPYLIKLSMVKAQEVDLSTLPYLPQLEEVDARMLTAIDVGPLAQQPLLKRISMQKSSVKHLAALASLSSLEWIRVSKGLHSEAELDGLREAIPLLQIGEF